MWFFGGSCISGKQPLLAQESNRSVSKLPSHKWSTQPCCSPAFCQLQTPLRHEFGQARGTTLLSLEGTFSPATGALGTLQSLAAGAESGAGDPPASPLHHHHPALAHSHPGQLTVTNKHHRSTELQMFPTNSPNTLCHTS